MVALELAYSGECVCSVPTFILFNLLPESDRYSILAEDYETGIDLIAEDADSMHTSEQCVRFFKIKIPWQDLLPHLSLPDYFEQPFQVLWESKEIGSGELLFRLRVTPFPEKIYRYFLFHEEWTENLLGKGELFMPCPAMFNDPFDCGLDESARLKFIESAMVCFSTKGDNVLMFSHYGDNHRGFSVGFHTLTLLRSLDQKNQGLHPSIRPVFYFPKAPALVLETELALCATCKSDVWKYENEFRLFMSTGPQDLASFGSFCFDREAIREVIVGCKASDETISACKIHTNDLKSCTRVKAFKEPNSFEIHRHKIM